VSRLCDSYWVVPKIVIHRNKFAAVSVATICASSVTQLPTGSYGGLSGYSRGKDYYAATTWKPRVFSSTNKAKEPYRQPTRRAAGFQPRRGNQGFGRRPPLKTRYALPLIALLICSAPEKISPTPLSLSLNAPHHNQHYFSV
jgi:hypothetical protein